MKLRVKDFTTKVGSGVTPKGGAESYLSQGIPLFRSQNVVDNGFLLDDIAYISEEVDESMKGSRVKPGDVLLNITGASIGRCYFTSDNFERGNVNQHVCIVRPKRNIILPQFLHYNIISNVGKEFIRQSQTGANREGLTIEDIKNFSFEIPPLSEQQRIVDFLDEKTKAIDARISVLEKKSDAYTRLKASVINRAVTRGLNPNVTLKNSGIEWIGMIPEHWEVRRVKNLCDYVSRGSTPDYVEDSPYKVMNQATFSKGVIDENKIRFSSKNPSDSNIRKGDLIMASTGGGVLGKVLYFDSDDDHFYADSHVTIIRNSKGENLMKYLFYSFFIKYDEINATMVKGSTNQTELQRNNLIAYELAIPSIEEQKQIVDYLDTKCSEIDKAIDNIGKQIEALKRLKRSLINEVVTGKRKV